MHTSTRLGLDIPDGPDLESAYPADAAQSFGILDNAATYYEGTLVARPAASAVEHGRTYRTTDSGAETLSWADGSVWLPLGLIPVTTATNKSAVSGQAIIITGGSVTITLPSHSAGQIVGIFNGGSPGTIVSGSSITGRGLSGASSFLLSTVGACVILLDDGTHWGFLSGQQDSGWQSLTSILSANWVAGLGYAPSYRVMGDMVQLSGSVVNQTGGNSNAPFSTFPASIRPASLVVGGAASTGFNLTTAGAFTFLTTVGNGGAVGFDGASYRLV